MIFGASVCAVASDVTGMWGFSGTTVIGEG